VLGADVGLDAAQGEVHHGEAARGGVALLAVDADVAEPAAVGFDEFFRLHRGECSMRRTAILAILLCLPSVTIAHAEDLFDIRPMADGVYAAIAKPAYKVNCNTAIIENDDGVMVVDTHSKPSAARVIVEQLRGMTSKPVRIGALHAIFPMN